MFKDILGDAFPIIEKVAPIIATAIGSPMAGTSAVFAMNLISNAFGLNSSQFKQLSDAIMVDPSAKDKLSNIESNFSEFIKNNMMFKMPIKAKISVELEWDSNLPTA